MPLTYDVYGFTEWIENELRDRGWKPADLAAAAKIYPATLGRILNKERKAGPEICTAIANALKIPPEDVFRRAGLLPSIREDPTGYIQRIHDVMANLSPDEREEVLAYAYMRYRRQPGIANTVHTAESDA